jgi:hexosaminidase
MAWPRGLALSEVLWSAPGQHNFTDFAERLKPHMDVLRRDGIYVANLLYELDYSTSIDNDQLYLHFDKVLPDIVVNYSIDAERTWTPIASPLEIDSSMTLIARSETDQGFKGRPLKIIVDKHLAAGKTISLATEPAPQYQAGGIQSLINGIQGSDSRFGDNEWCGFSGTDLEATVDLGEVMLVSSVETRFFDGASQWIYLPANVEIQFSRDGSTYALAQRPERVETLEEPGRKEQVERRGKDMEAGARTYRLSVPPVEARYIKVIAKNFGQIPDGMPGAGHKAWLFVDEIKVH